MHIPCTHQVYICSIVQVINRVLLNPIATIYCNRKKNMEKSISKDRKTVDKTDVAIKIKQMLHSKEADATRSSNITYYYVFYGEKGNV
jgi:hypothetical protein